MVANENDIVVLGGGLTGLSAAHVLTRSGLRVKVIERDPAVGGLSKTIEKDGFRFDLGGHRLFTKKKKIEDFVRGLMDGELVSVSRSSKIYMRRRYFDYPLRPLNAMLGMGIPTTLRIMADYGLEKLRRMKLRRMKRQREDVSLEDWVVGNFGRAMYNIYFREYSEKVWGIDCARISAEWVEKRIQGLSLAAAVKNAFFKFSGRDIPTLADRFLYPKLGIGRISERLREEITRGGNEVLTDTGVNRIMHSDRAITGIAARKYSHSHVVPGGEFISSIPVTRLVEMLEPSPPSHVLEAASRLRYRDIVIVALMIDRARVTDQTWIYIPEMGIPFGRIHEPTNWSEEMAPAGKTIMVMEYFCFKGDGIWNECDDGLAELTVQNLEALDFIKKREVLGFSVVRAPKAYPLFEVGYEGHCRVIYDYLSQFQNLHPAGRMGMFRYYNMDHAIESGIAAAEKILERSGPRRTEGKMTN